jgi:hypothetical protein
MHEDHLTESDLAGFLDGELDEGAQTRVERHLDACDECRAELVAVARLLEPPAAQQLGDISDLEAASGIDTGAPRAAGSGSARARRRWRFGTAAGGLAAAAAVALLVLVPPGGDPYGGTVVERERFVEDDRAVLPVHAPADGTALPHGGVTFVWGGAGADTYRLTVTTEDGGVAWSHVTADTLAAAPADAPIEPGGTYFWYVDALHGGIVARSEVRSFTVAR